MEVQQADFEAAAHYADLADEKLDEAERFESIAQFCDAPADAARFRQAAMYSRVEAGHFRLCEKQSLRGEL